MGQIEIAKIANVNQSTVSRALRNDTRICPEVRKRVLDAAKQLGYKPDFAVQALAERRWSKDTSRCANVACLCGRDVNGTRVSEIATAAARNGLAMSQFRIDGRRSIQGLVRILRTRGIRGVIMDSVETKILEEIDLSEFCVVQVGRRSPPVRFHWVGHDYYAIGRDLLEGAIERGYKRIGCIFVRTNVRWDDDMRMASVDGVRDRSPGIRIPPILWLRVGDGSFYRNLQLVDEFIRKWKVESIVGFGPLIAAILRELRISVPDQIPLALLHGSPDMGPAVAPVLCETPIANMAIHLLNGMLRDNECGAPRQPMSLVLRSHELDWSSFPNRTASGRGRRATALKMRGSAHA